MQIEFQNVNVTLTNDDVEDLQRFLKSACKLLYAKLEEYSTQPATTKEHPHTIEIRQTLREELAYGMFLLRGLNVGATPQRLAGMGNGTIDDGFELAVDMFGEYDDDDEEVMEVIEEDEPPPMKKKRKP